VSSGRRLALVAVVLVTLAAGLAVSRVRASDGGPISRRGTYEGGRYLIEVPASWNGGLVLFAHGYDGGTFGSPLTSHLLDRGYALAASSYRTEGYRVDLFVDDMRALLDLFIREVRRPRWTVIHGQSMGGHVAIVSLELHPGLYQGRSSSAGSLMGSGMPTFTSPRARPSSTSAV
jgi:pimeloyl-ACP methyl ester carboxylesterase